MSWSVNFNGTPEEVSEKLEQNSTALAGASLEEFDAAKPHLIGLLKQNTKPVQLEAWGSGETASRECSVSLKILR